MRSLALAVPSLLSTSELNFLINPNHRHFKKIRIGKPQEYRFGERSERLDARVQRLLRRARGDTA